MKKPWIIDWSDQDRAQILRMYGDEYTFSHIANVFSNIKGHSVSRSSIAGMVKRYAEPRAFLRTWKSALVPKPRKPRPVNRIERPILVSNADDPQKIKPLSMSVELLQDQTDATKAVMAWKAGFCHFSIGDPKKPGFRYCMEKIGVGELYCENCRGLVYVSRSIPCEKKRKPEQQKILADH